MTGSSHRLLTAEREQRILQLLKDKDVMTVSALSQALNISEATVRRDLQSMQERSLLSRLHGGAAYKPEAMVEPIFADKEGRHAEEKQRIAAKALSLIKDNDAIFLDGGSTVLKLAQMLDARKGLTIVTNSLMAAAILMESGHRLILTGGEFRAISRTLVGPLSAAVLQELVVDCAFMGTFGYTSEDGMSTTDANEAFTKTQAMTRAKQVVLLADNSKLGHPSFVRTSCEKLDILVTDDISDELKKDLEDKGIKVLIA